MTRRSPARLLAPLALVVAAVALFAVVTSGSGDAGEETTTGAPQPTATATPAADRERRARRRTYTVQAGDTPSSIAEDADVPLDELLEANPDVDPNALSPGQKLRLPRE